jgi:hypothetical protein
LEAAPQIDDEWMLHSKQHLLLIIRVIDLLRLDDLFLVKDLDGVKPEVVFASDCQTVSVRIRVKRSALPRWTRPKLPVPRVRWK